MTARGPITTHVLDTSLGLPAQGVPVSLFAMEGGVARPIADRTTDADGRIVDFLPPGKAAAGEYRLVFDVDPYFRLLGVTTFYRTVQIDFILRDVDRHHHVPLLLNPYGYSTYRGS